MFGWQKRFDAALGESEMFGDGVEFMLVADVVCRQVAPSCHSGTTHPLDASHLLHNKEAELSLAKLVNTDDKMRKCIRPIKLDKFCLWLDVLNDECLSI